MICQKLVVTETLVKKNTKKETGLKKTDLNMTVIKK